MAPPKSPSDPTPPAPPDASGYEFSEQIGHLLRRAYQRHLAIFSQTIDDPQLTSVQFAVLSANQRLGLSSMSDLGKATAIDVVTVRGIIERLQSRCLIEFMSNTVVLRKI